MKKLYNLIIGVFLSVYGFSQNAQIPNNGFEDWTTDETTSMEVAVPWYGIDYLYKLFAVDVPPVITKTTDAANGTYAMKISTIEFDGTEGKDTLSGIVCSGETGIIGLAFAQNPGPQIPVGPDLPVKLTVNYKYIVPNQGVDAGQIVVLFYKEGAANGVVQFYLDPTETYANMAFPIELQEGIEIDSAAVVIVNNNGEVDPVPGTELYIDDIAFEYAGNAVQELVVLNHDVNVFPTVADQQINFEIASGKAEVLITDMTGKTVMSAFTDGKLTIETGSLSNGSYLYTVKHADYTTSGGKFMVKH